MSHRNTDRRSGFENCIQFLTHYGGQNEAMAPGLLRV
jgi:hypothetical protein